MATTITIPGGQAGKRIADAFAALYGWQEQVPDPDDAEKTIDNPVSKEEFARQKIADHVAETVASYEGMTAGDSARNRAVEKARKEVKLS